VEDFALAGGDGTPSQIVSARELLQQCQARLTADERALLEQRRAGQGWDEIAEASGKSAEAIRKQYQRAIKRVSAELGMQEFADD
jgi:DNA-directed RNA polymerase specialized sigma24 family protein